MSEDGDRHNSAAMVDRQVECGNGGKPAFVASDAILTYDGLRRRVNRAGNLLHELEIGRAHV